MKERFAALVLAILAVLTMSQSPALTQPIAGGKTIRIVVPFTAGSGADGVARLFAEHLQKRLGQPVIVENKFGASGNIGTTFVARAEPDGTTFLLTANTIVMNVGLFKNLEYHPSTSFTPIMQVGTGYLVLVTNPAFPPKTVKEFIEYVKERPGKVDYASPGRGTPHHLSMELFKQSTGIDLTHVPYTGLAQSLTDLIAGHVNTMFTVLPTIQQQVRAGQARILGIGSKERARLAPEIPTIAEQGVADFDVGIWFGLFAPAGTPASVVEIMNREVNEILKLPDVRAYMDRQGIEIVGGTPERLEKLVATDLQKWLTVIEKAKIGSQ